LDFEFWSLRRAPVSVCGERVKVHALAGRRLYLATHLSKVLINRLLLSAILLANPTTPTKRPAIKHIFDTPSRADLIHWLRSDPAHRRFSIGQRRQSSVGEYGAIRESDLLALLVIQRAEGVAGEQY
jgi:hypothetical protein